MGIRGKSDPEWQEQVTQIRAAARRGESPAAIADRYSLPRVAVERILTPSGHPRLSDPIGLLHTRKEAPGLAPADIQLYWLGFLTAAGYIRGQGNGLTLVVTLGAKSERPLETFMADLAPDHLRHELCYSSIAGWQLYVRDQSLCKALIPWGVPSDPNGGDPTVLDDLPDQFVAPFIRGYVDGNWPARQTLGDGKSFVLHGSPTILAGINDMMRRCWAVTGRVVGQRSVRAELRFSNPQACRTIVNRLKPYASRVDGAREQANLGQ